MQGLPPFTVVRHDAQGREVVAGLTAVHGGAQPCLQEPEASLRTHPMVDDTIQRVSVNGITLHVQLAGWEQSGPVELLVHGFPDDHSVWRHQFRPWCRPGIASWCRTCAVVAKATFPQGKTGLPPRCAGGRPAGFAGSLRYRQGAPGGARLGCRSVLDPRRAASPAGRAVLRPVVGPFVRLHVRGAGSGRRGTPLRECSSGPLVECGLLRLNGWWLFRTLYGYPQNGRPFKPACSGMGACARGWATTAATWTCCGRRRPVKVAVPVMGLWSEADRFLTEKQMTDSAALCTQGFVFLASKPPTTGCSCTSRKP
jgi:pimeloyl-ACP methyl ester carboxylesterase